jgi:thiamine-phosphate pyrophosphorylase
MISYLITDPKYYSNNPKTFSQNLEKSIKKYNPEFVCFRDKSSKNIDELIKAFLTVSKKYNKKSFINSHINQAIKYNSQGVHLTSTQFDEIKFCKDNHKLVTISTHNEDDIKLAIKLQADFITYSPIFDTPNKGPALGVNKLETIQSKYNIPIIALGGIISKEHLKKLKDIHSFGFASIRYFID